MINYLLPEDWYRITVLVLVGIAFIAGIYIAGEIVAAIDEWAEKRRNR